MGEILGYVLSWILDATVPGLRAIWGNWGCFMVSILAAGVLFWFVPAYVLDLQGDDWKTWLVVGPLATIAVVIMVAGTYGLTRGGRAQSGEPTNGGSAGGQEPGTRSDIKECAHCGAALKASAVVCRHCGEPA